MLHSYYLSVGGIRILFEADTALIENPEFHPFLMKQTAPELYVKIRNAKQMPMPSDTPIYSDMFCNISKNQKGHLQKIFFNDDDGSCIAASYHPNGREILIEYPDGYGAGCLDLQNCFYCMGFEENLLRNNKFCLHASCVDTPLGGLLFSGISGIGKSTQADLWCKFRNAKQINGDRPILSREGQEWFAWGSPYAGSSRCYVNDCCKIRAILLLKQGAVCEIRRLTLAEAFRGIWAGLTVHSWDKSFVEKASALTIELINSVPVYEFCCTPDETAVKFLEEKLRGECI